VTQAAVQTNLLHALEVVSELGVEVVRHNLIVFAVAAIVLNVQEPLRNVKLQRIRDDSLNRFDLILAQLAGAANQSKQQQSTANRRNSTQRNAVPGNARPCNAAAIEDASTVSM
jgi:hypothetical protein